MTSLLICLNLLVSTPDSTLSKQKAYDQLINLQESYIRDLESDREQLLLIIEQFRNRQVAGLSVAADSLSAQSAGLAAVHDELAKARETLKNYRDQSQANEWKIGLLWGGSGLLAGLLIGLLLN
ncbi:MAG: hypothetical protein HUU10_12240 [Bacteroidetes bacterium]|nr:hypothetical protein [Bacteroidota bacterium]